MPGLLAYQNMAAAASRRAAEVKPRMPARMEDAQKLPPPAKALPKGMAFRKMQIHENAWDSARSKLFGTDANAEKQEQQYQSSGSDHEPSSVCLAAMVDEFMEDQAAFCHGKSSRSDRGLEKTTSSLGGEILEILKGHAACTSLAEKKLLEDASRAINVVKDQASSICKEDGLDCPSDCLKRAVMKHLRAAGYNAAICKSRWDHAGGFPGGDYEYIDVLLEDSGDSTSERLIIDVNFREQFEIARPTDSFSAVLQELPNVFVGKEDRLRQIVNLMCDAVKESLKKRGMPVPPWRKAEHMRSKWFSSYKRTTNEAVHPHNSTVARSLSRTAFRGSRLDSKFTNELERQLDRSNRRMNTSVNNNSHANESRGSSTPTAEPLPQVTTSMNSNRRPRRTSRLAEALFEAGVSSNLVAAVS